MGILEGKRALVTGARRGIGRATVEVFAREGACVWACARSFDASFEEEMRALASSCGVEIRSLYFDMRDDAAMKSAMSQIRASGEPLDAAVLLAGVISNSASFRMTSLQAVRDVYEINLVSQMRIVQYCLRMMKDRASVVAVSSIAADGVIPGQYAYTCSKAAVEAWVKALAQELGGKARVNAVAPGFVDTDMGNEATSDLLDRIVASTAMKRMARPEEIANVIAMLSSDYCSYVTGQVLKVDGGGSS